MTPPRGIVLSLGERRPRIHPSVFIAPTALVAGDVVIEEDASVWPGAVLRGDHGQIRVGARTNIQDGSVIHATARLPTVLGADVVIGHGARLEGCVVEDAALIGIGAVVLSEAHIGSGAIVAAGAVVAPRTLVPEGAMALGVPATVRPAPDDQTVETRRQLCVLNAALYVESARHWMAQATDDPEGGGLHSPLPGVLSGNPVPPSSAT